MVRVHSPGYPQFGLPKAIASVKKIFDADRRNAIARAAAAKHIGYSGPSGAADKALATLAHYGLVEKAGKGELKVSQLAVDIIHPDPHAPENKKSALLQAAFTSNVFADLRERFGTHFSNDALESYLLRSNFLNVAIKPVIKSYSETCSYLEQEKAFESGGPSVRESDISDDNEDGTTVFGGARVGDLIQWEIDDVLQLERPMRVRLVDEVDGRQYVAVEGSETGIPMEQVIVQERATVPPIETPMFKLKPKTDEIGDSALELGWKEERLIDDGGEEIFIRYKGEPSPERYTYIRDYLDFKLSRMNK